MEQLELVGSKGGKDTNRKDIRAQTHACMHACLCMGAYTDVAGEVSVLLGV